MDLLEQFKSFVKENNLLPDGRPTLLTVSGGVDSVVMAQMFRAAGHPFGIAHCNFQLRGAESDGDELFVRQLAAGFDVLFFAKRFETTPYADQHGLSIQMAARALRYAWFAEVAVENGFAQIATAHNLNDSVETALLNFVRGTGLAGLGGIAPLNPTPDPSPNGRGDVERIAAYAASPLPLGEGSGVGLIRPLLFATRPDIEAYARAQHLAWREDSSNASDDYARNFLRHRVVPMLEELNPNFLHTAARNLRRLRGADANLDFLLKKFLAIDVDGVTGSPPINTEATYHIDKQKIAQLPAPRQALHHLLKPQGFTDEQARQLADNLGHVGLELYADSGWRLLNDREKVFVVSPNPQSPIPNPQSPIPIAPDDLMVSLPNGGRLVFMPTNAVAPFPDGHESIMVDAEKLRFPLHLRPWQPGDAFQPFGMNGHTQKLQDFFTNLKLSRLEKEKVWVLENGDGVIVWVVGHRLDERFRVTADTSKFLKINYL